MEKIKSISDTDRRNELSANAKKIEAVLEGRPIKPYKTDDVKSLTDIIKDNARKSLVFNSEYKMPDDEELKQMARAHLKHTAQRNKIIEAQIEIDEIGRFLENMLDSLVNRTNINKPNDISKTLDTILKFKHVIEDSETIIDTKHEESVTKPFKHEMPKYKTSGPNENINTDIKFANILSNVHSPIDDIVTTASSKEIEDPLNDLQSTDISLASATSNEIKELIKRKMLEPTREAIAEDEREKTLIETKQYEQMRTKSIQKKVYTKREEQAVDFVALTETEVEEKKEFQRIKEENKEDLIKILPMLDEKHRFFELVFGDKAQALRKQITEEFEETLNKRLEDQSSKQRAEFEDKISNSDIDKANSPLEVSQREKNQPEPTSTDESLSKDEIEKSKIANSAQISDITHQIKLIKEEVDQHVLKLGLKLKDFLNGVQELDADKLKNDIEVALQETNRIQEVARSLKKTVDEIEKQDLMKTEKNIPSHMVHSQNSAESMAEEIISSVNLKKLDDVQKKLTPWAVTQLLY